MSHVQNVHDNVYHAYHQDEQGSTAYITEQDRETENIYQYDAFGNLAEKKEGITNRILYTGQQYDQETGQYYLRARYYNPVVGRFMQEDTYRGDGLNLYAYCANNPVVYYDPSGHDPQYSDTGEKVPDGQAGSDGGSNSQKILGGSFEDVNAGRGADEVGHHLPQNAYNTRELGMTRGEGPALLMTKEDHALTRTYRGRGKQTMIDDIGLNARQRMVEDIINIRENFGTKYNEGLLEVIKYANTLPQFQK